MTTTHETPDTATGRPLGDLSRLLFGHLHRSDQQRWGRVYLQGLLRTDGKKTVRRMAAVVTGSEAASTSLHQFVNASPWEWAPARGELARWAARSLPVRAWTLAPAVLPKRGDRSAGVHQRFLPDSGRTVNCQLGIGLFLDVGRAHVPVDWRLFLPPRFTGDTAVRDRAKIPAATRAQPLWEHALSLVQEMAPRADGRTAPVVADLTALCDIAPLARRLRDGGHPFVLAIPGQSTLDGPELPPGERESARALLLRRGVRHPAGAGRQILSYELPARGPRPGGEHGHGPGQLMAEWDAGTGRPGRIWLTNITDRHPAELLELARSPRGAQAAVRRMGEDFGLLDFEGRSFPGWHRHMTLVSAAYACSALEGMTP
ncbi:transcriptional regulator [Kitasatospora albolonga]|uniref:Transcriptional regulator n=1 Tax=Kitasatospora albolonga TaxID=68173 RepID=A0ABC8BTF4_9ACTN|nr:transcriptional regulator [Kitasatospora albolonga]